MVYNDVEDKLELVYKLPFPYKGNKDGESKGVNS